MIAVLDIGKTNKKCLVFDAEFRVVWEKTTQLPETVDEDGDACEDLALLTSWVHDTVREVLRTPEWPVAALNFTSYGASLVHLDAEGQPLTPLYNYLKPFPQALRRQFFERYGDEATIARETASPILGSLNAGLQMYRLSREKPAIFAQIKYSLHLPQYIASLVSRVFCSEITSLGCHTLLRDFQRNDYHDWAKTEGVAGKFPPLRPCTDAVSVRISTTRELQVGTGLHDSSAALIPYLEIFKEPFLLLSTGTWCISLNPFNAEPLTDAELEQDCLCYLTREGRPVKAARFFGGHRHREAVAKLAADFGAPDDFYRTLTPESASPIAVAYADFMRTFTKEQAVSIRLALGRYSAVRRIFVDGGFSANEIFLNLLAAAFPQMEIYAAEIAQATALGAALVLRPGGSAAAEHLVSLKKYAAKQP